jgi:hypothetical protein
MSIKCPTIPLNGMGFGKCWLRQASNRKSVKAPKTTLNIVNSLGLINSYRKALRLSNELAAKASRVTSVVNINGMVLAPIIRGYRLDVEMHLNIVNLFIVLGP